MRIRPAQVVVVAAARIDELLKISHDHIVRSMSARIGTHRIVHLAPSVRREHDRDMVVVQPRDILVGEQHPVRRERQFELLARLLLTLTHVLRHRLHRTQIHQRLAAEEINLTVFARAAAVNDKIDRRTSHLGRHHCTVPAIAAAVAETILTSQIAVLCHHQTQGFHQSARLEGRRHIDIGGKERPCRHQLVQLAACLAQILLRITPPETCHDSLIVRPIEVIHHIVNHLVDHVNRTAVHIDENVHTVLLELMRSDFHLFSFITTLGNVIRLSKP